MAELVEHDDSLEIHSKEILEFMSLVRAAKEADINQKMFDLLEDMFEEEHYFVPGGVYYLEPTLENLKLILDYRQVNLEPEDFLNKYRSGGLTGEFQMDPSSWEELSKLLIYNPAWIDFIFGSESEDQEP